MEKIFLSVSPSSVTEVKNVLYVPDLNVNLLPVSQIVKKNSTVVFNIDGCSVYDSNKKLIASGVHENGLFKLNFSNTEAKSFHVDIRTDKNLWHRRLGHINNTSLMKMKNGMVNGVDFRESGIYFKCEVCVQAKCHRLPFESSQTRSKEFLEIIHSDICGPMEAKSFGGLPIYIDFLG